MSVVKPPSSLWLKWKSLRLPWRKWFLRGQDLTGNTFWEFRQTLSDTGRMRRIVKYNYDVKHSDVKVSPAWMQWLRHTRLEAPTIQEQQQDVVRQQQMKTLAAEADARWAAQPSYLVPPDKPAALGADLQEMARMVVPPEQRQLDDGRTVVDAGGVEHQPSKSTLKPSQPSPWSQATKKMDEPEPWSPTISKR